jgi:hypothetical protein
MTNASRLAVTCAMAALIAALHVLPVPGAPPIDGPRLPAAFTVAAIAVQSWISAAALGQILLLFAPRANLRRSLDSRSVDPFGRIVLGGACLIAWISADDNATRLMTYDAVANAVAGRSFGKLFASMLGGAAAVVAAASLIERFGLGRGFWVAVAIHFVMMLTEAAATADFWAAATARAPTTASVAMLVALAVMVIAMTLHAMRSPGGFELVAWPLLLLPIAIVPVMIAAMAALGFEPGRKGMPENILGMTLSLFVTLAIVVAAMVHRSGRRELFVPLLATLAAVHGAAALLVREPVELAALLDAGGFVVVLALIAVGLQRGLGASGNLLNLHRGDRL